MGRRPLRAKNIALQGRVCEAGGVNVKGDQPILAGEREEPAGSGRWRWFVVALLTFGTGWGGAVVVRAADMEGRPRDLWERARGQMGQGDDFSAAASAEELLREPGFPLPVIQGAWRMVARGYALYGTPAGWAKVRAASEVLLEMPGLPAEWRVEALRDAASAAVELRMHTGAELVQRALLAEPRIGLLERERVRLGLARSLWAQRAFAEWRETLEQMGAAFS